MQMYVVYAATYARGRHTECVAASRSSVVYSRAEKLNGREQDTRSLGCSAVGRALCDGEAFRSTGNGGGPLVLGVLALDPSTV